MDLFPQNEEQKKFALFILAFGGLTFATVAMHLWGAWATLIPTGLFAFMVLYEYSIIPTFFPQANLSFDDEMALRFKDFLEKQSESGNRGRTQVLREVAAQREIVNRLEAQQKEMLATISTLVRAKEPPPPPASADAPDAEGGMKRVELPGAP